MRGVLARLFGRQPATRLPIDAYIPVLSRALAGLADLLEAESTLPDLMSEASRGSVTEDEFVARLTGAQQAATRLHEAAQPLTTVVPKGFQIFGVHQAALKAIDAKFRAFLGLMQMLEASDATTADGGISYRRAGDAFQAANRERSVWGPRLQSELKTLRQQNPDVFARLKVPGIILTRI